MEHTKGPWEYVNVAKGSWMIENVDRNRIIAYVGICDPHGDCEANARHIVKCVNSHDALCESLHAVLAELIGYYMENDEEEIPTPFGEMIEAKIEQAKAALAAAEEE